MPKGADEVGSFWHVGEGAVSCDAVCSDGVTERAYRGEANHPYRLALSVSGLGR